MTTRGIRNNNPGNIRHGDKWQGLAADQSGDPSFCIFTDAVWGIRAIVRVLLNYQKAGVQSVAGAIGRWAPPNENNTTAYIDAVAQAVGVDPVAKIDFDQSAIMLPMVKAIIVHENGSNPYPDSLVQDAMRRAGIADAPQVPLTKKLAGPALTGASLALGAASQLAEPAKQAADVLSPFAASPWIQKIVTIVLTIAGLAAFAVVAQRWVDHRRGL